MFLVGQKTGSGWAPRHELLATGQGTAITWMSGRASSQYASNGGDQGQVINGRNSPAYQPAPVQQANVDCGRFGSMQRIACETANNSGLGAAIGVGKRALGN